MSKRRINNSADEPSTSQAHKRKRIVVHQETSDDDEEFDVEKVCVFKIFCCHSFQETGVLTFFSFPFFQSKNQNQT